MYRCYNVHGMRPSLIGADSPACSLIWKRDCVYLPPYAATLPTPAIQKIDVMAWYAAIYPEERKNTCKSEVDREVERRELATTVHSLLRRGTNGRFFPASHTIYHHTVYTTCIQDVNEWSSAECAQFTIHTSQFTSHKSQFTAIHRRPCLSK